METGTTNASSPADTEIEERFSYHAVNDEGRSLLNLMRVEFGGLAHLIVGTVRHSRDRSLALTKLEEAMFHANAAISRTPSLQIGKPGDAQHPAEVREIGAPRDLTSDRHAVRAASAPCRCGNPALKIGHTVAECGPV